MQFRIAAPAEFPRVEELVIASFEPITWFKKIDERFGPLNGCDWRERWHQRLEKVFATQIILAGEVDGEIAAVSTGTYEASPRLGFIDLLAVDQHYQGRGFGKLMLGGMVEHLRGLGARYVHLDCLMDNEKGMGLYARQGWAPVAGSMKWFLEIPPPPA